MRVPIGGGPQNSADEQITLQAVSHRRVRQGIVVPPGRRQQDRGTHKRHGTRRSEPTRICIFARPPRERLVCLESPLLFPPVVYRTSTDSQRSERYEPLCIRRASPRRAETKAATTRRLVVSLKPPCGNDPRTRDDQNAHARTRARACSSTRAGTPVRWKETKPRALTSSMSGVDANDRKDTHI